jgi:hypothetical protein
MRTILRSGVSLIGRVAWAAVSLAILVGCTSTAGGTATPVGSLETLPPIATDSIPSGEHEPPFPATSYPPAEFWEMTAPGGFNAESYRSLASMAKAADAVVTGTAASIRKEPDRHLELDPADGSFATIEFKVEDVLAGRPEYVQPGVLNVELFMTDPLQYQRLAAGLPAGRVMLFLRNKAVEATDNGWPAEGPDAGHLYYRIVSENGVILDVDGAAVPNGTGSDWLDAIAKETFSEVTAEVKAAAG